MLFRTLCSLPTPIKVNGSRVLELGAGCGLVGIVAGVCGAIEVTMTDLPHSLPLIESNIEHHRTLLSHAGCRKICCQSCDWLVPPPKELLSNAPYDVILVADCVWMQELVAPLLNTIKRLSAPLPADEDGALSEHTTKAAAGAKITTKVLISYQRRGKPTDDAFWTGIHSLFRTVLNVDVTTVGLIKRDSFCVLECQL